MNYKGILLDIDNTLYNYESCHRKAIKAVIDMAISAIQNDNLKAAYAQARQQIHCELAETASSHNRLLYFQRACELVGLNPLVWALKFYNVYWDTFLDSIELYAGVLEFLENTSQKYTICFVTDLTAHIQYRKIAKLGLAKYVSHIVTSEEAGREKPHPYMFLFAMHKINLQAHEVCMVGDSYAKDILGATALGIQSIWLNTEHRPQEYDRNLVTEVNEFQKILELL